MKESYPETIYLMPDGEGCVVWCDHPSPAEGMGKEDAVRYVRADTITQQPDDEELPTYLKEGETPLECIKRNREDVKQMILMLAEERKKVERLESQQSEPVAWAAFTAEGRIRIWASHETKAHELAGAIGQDLLPLYFSATVKNSLTVPSCPIGYLTKQAAGRLSGEDPHNEYLYCSEPEPTHKDKFVPLYTSPQPTPQVRVPTEIEAEKIAEGCRCDDGTYNLTEVIEKLANFMYTAAPTPQVLGVTDEMVDAAVEEFKKHPIPNDIEYTRVMTKALRSALTAAPSIAETDQ